MSHLERLESDLLSDFEEKADLSVETRIELREELERVRADPSFGRLPRIFATASLALFVAATLLSIAEIMMASTVERVHIGLLGTSVVFSALFVWILARNRTLARRESTIESQLEESQDQGRIP